MIPVTGPVVTASARFAGVYNVRHVVINQMNLSTTPGETAQRTAKALLSEFATQHAKTHTPASANAEDWFGSANHDLFSPKKSLGLGYLILNDDKGADFTHWNEGVQSRETHQPAQEKYMQSLASGAVKADLIVTSDSMAGLLTGNPVGPFQFDVKPVAAKKSARRRVPVGNKAS